MSQKKKMIFVSAGRCGTTRISEILRKTLPDDNFNVLHQMPFSRLGNIVGNLFYYFNSDMFKKLLFRFIVYPFINSDKHFICTDPLISMIIPYDYIKSYNVAIIHIKREPKSFAKSFYNFSRKKRFSFIAHNFVPFWQIGLLPLENMLSNSIIEKYVSICNKKNKWFYAKYHINNNYKIIDYKKLFKTPVLENTINSFFGMNVSINENDLEIKSNESFR